MYITSYIVRYCIMNNDAFSHPFLSSICCMNFVIQGLLRLSPATLVLIALFMPKCKMYFVSNLL